MFWRHTSIPHINNKDGVLLLVMSIYKFDALLNMYIPIYETFVL